MSKTRVYVLAKELGLDNKEFITRLERLGIAVKSHSSTLSDNDVERIRKEFALGERSKVVEKRVKSTVIRRRRVAEIPVKEAKPPDTEERETAETDVVPVETPAAAIETKPTIEKKEETKIPEISKAEVTDITEIKVSEAKAEAVEKEPRIEKETKPEIEKKEVTEPAEATKEEDDEKEKKETIKPREQRKPDAGQPVKPEEIGVTAEKVSPEIEKKEKPEDAAPVKKKKRPIEVVMEEQEAPRKKAFTKHRIGKKTKRLEKDGDEGRIVARKMDKKEAVLKMKKTEITTPKAIKRRIKVGEAIRVGDLAKKMGVKSNEVISKLISLGIMVTINQSIDSDVASLVASEFEYQVEHVGFEYDEIVQKVETPPEKLRPRAPVVTVMGHVDHGKTSLLDAIRETHVIDGEAGGITQAIGAYHVHINERDIVFVDTPGHEAFTSMRARGAQVTDIVVLVVAADDGVMDQTIEAINHSKAAGVPIIVAINKIDKSGANADQIKQKLSELELVPEEWGGETIFAEVSAKKRIGIEEMLELILLQADIMELKADPDRLARGVIIESALDKGRGPVATVIIQEGTLSEGDAFVSKTEYGRVRALIDDKGLRATKAGPSMPVEVIGFSKVPKAGMEFICVDDEKTARNIAEYWTTKEREKELSKTSKITLEQLYERIKEGAKEFNVIIKGDVQGSIEALSDNLLKLSTEDVKLRIIHSSTGAVTETDVLLASASDAIIIGFKVRPDARVEEMAEKEGVEIKLYDVIYNAIADVKAGMEGLLEPIYREILQGRAEVRDLFKVPKIGTIAGSYVIDGKVARNSNLRLVRDGVVIYDGKILSLKRFKDDAKEVVSGFECGIGLEGFNDVKVGDILESYTEEEIERTL
jgi:translation initiation factor IF-2